MLLFTTHHLLSSLFFLIVTNKAYGQDKIENEPMPINFDKECYRNLIRNANNKKRPLVIGHRGSSFNLPEHTLASYRLALELGADYIEPDLVPTKDLRLVAFHSVDLNTTTDVAQKFPDRYRTNVTHDGISLDGYFVQDFTLEEIKSLRVRQRVEDTVARSRHFDWLFEIPTFKEILDLLYGWYEDVETLVGKEYRQSPGLYVELKRPGWLGKELNTRVEDLLLNELKAHPIKDKLFRPDLCTTKYLTFDNIQEYPYPPLVLQCFDQASLVYLTEKIKADNVTFNNIIPPSIRLVSSKTLNSDPEFLFHALSDGVLSGVGPDKEYLLHNLANGKNFVQLAHERNLAVHPWTERLEKEFIASRFYTLEEEIMYLFCDMKVDGLFLENVDLGVRFSHASCSHVNVTASRSCEEVNDPVIQSVIGMVGATVGGMIIGAIIFGMYTKGNRTSRRGRAPEQQQTGSLQRNHHDLEFDEEDNAESGKLNIEHWTFT